MLFNRKYDQDLMHDASTSHQPSLGSLLADDAENDASNHAQSAKPRKVQTRSVIDACLLITGTLEGDGELQIDGQVLGDIRCTHLTVGKDATVDGTVAADEVVVRGTVKGVIGANRVILMDSAQVESDIFHKKLAIEEGACFDGVARVRENPIDELDAMAAAMKAAEQAKDETESDAALAAT